MDPVTSGMDPTVPLEAFANSTYSTGGDSRLYNLNVFYNVSTGHVHESQKTLWYAGLMSWFLARRHRLDDYINRARPAHDPGCRVSLPKHATALTSHVHKSNRTTASSTQDWPEESLRYRCYGCPSWPRPSFPFNGSCGVTL